GQAHGRPSLFEADQAGHTNALPPPLLEVREPRKDGADDQGRERLIGGRRPEMQEHPRRCRLRYLNADDCPFYRYHLIEMILRGRIRHDELVRWVSGHLGADRGCGDDQSDDDKESCWSHGIAPDEVDVSCFPFPVSRFPVVAHTPVLPNPPPPRSLGGSSATSSSSTTSTRRNTSCAMRVPRVTTTRSVPRLIIGIISSPR